METIYISNAINNARSIEQVVELINEGGTCEGMEGIEFSPEMLAGQYANDAAEEYASDRDSVIAHLEFLAEAGAVFDERKAADWAMKIQAASDE